jgi:hypothetical protein
MAAGVAAAMAERPQRPSCGWTYRPFVGRREPRRAQPRFPLRRGLRCKLGAVTERDEYQRLRQLADARIGVTLSG